MALLKQQPPNPRPRRHGPCHRHPNIPVTTGLCPSCLRERLSLLNPKPKPNSTSSNQASTSDAGAPPELRRCKTFSANVADSVLGLALEPRRRSCDVRARNSLATLFDLDDDGGNNGGSSEVLRVESKNLGFLRQGTCPVPEEEEEVESNCDFEVARVRPADLENVDEFEESKTMQEFIDLEFQASTKPNNSNRRDFKEIAGSFWVAASVFSKKLRKWKKKQGTREHMDECNGDGDGGVGLGEMQLERLRGRRLRTRDTQSEVGEYGFGRRSCDTDPRGSLDLGRASTDNCAFGRMSCDTDPRFSIDLGRASIDCGRISVEEARSSFDAPRASWDGYLVGGRTMAMPRCGAPVVSVIENAMATVYGFDHPMLAGGKMKVENRDERDCRRSKQTKDQFFDAQTKGFDQSSSQKKDLVVIDDREAKPLSNARVSPAAIGIVNGTKLLITEKELNEWRLNSLKDDSSESFETASKDLTSVSSSSTSKDFKKCRQWSKLWSIWGLLHRRKGNKYGTKEKLEECPPRNSADNTTRNGNEPLSFDPDWKLPRSHSTTSSRGSSIVVGSSHGTRKTEGKAIVKRRPEDVLDRSRSARYSPNHLDNGLLRFYLTPLRSRRRSKLAKGKLKNSRSLARTVLKL